MPSPLRVLSATDWRTTAQKSCAYCGEVFWPRPKELRRAWQRRALCSPECSGRATRAAAAKKNTTP